MAVGNTIKGGLRGGGMAVIFNTITRSLTVGASLMVTGVAIADVDSAARNAFLKGTYRHSTTDTCVESNAGFTPRPALQANGFGIMGQDYSIGHIEYDGNGHATERSRGIFLFPGPFGPGSFMVVTFEANCSYTYAVNPDFSFSQEGSCTGNLVDGPTAGETFAVSGLRIVGQIGVGGLLLLTNQIEPVEIALENSGGFRTRRLCGAAGIAVRTR
jgi:hypothetical protein